MTTVSVSANPSAYYSGGLFGRFRPRLRVQRHPTAGDDEGKADRATIFSNHPNALTRTVTSANLSTAPNGQQNPESPQTTTMINLVFVALDLDPPSAGGRFMEDQHPAFDGP